MSSRISGSKRLAVLAAMGAAAMVGASSAQAMTSSGALDIQSTASINENGYTYSYTLVPQPVPVMGDGLDGPPDIQWITLPVPVHAFTLPMMSDQVSNIQAPEGWMATLLPHVDGDGWNYNPGTDPMSASYGVDPSMYVSPEYLMTFSYTGGDFGDYWLTQPLSGFSFDGVGSPQGAPVMVDMGGESFVDPLIPGAPAALVTAPATPEPASAVLVVMAGAAVASGATRRRRGA